MKEPLPSFLRLQEPVNFELEVPALGPLGKVNLFVGPNNSGKSRYLRLLFSKFAQVQALKSVSQFEFPLSQVQIQLDRAVHTGLDAALALLIPDTIKTASDVFQMLRGFQTIKTRQDLSGTNLLIEMGRVEKTFGAEWQRLNDYSYFYFPTLRGLRGLDGTEGDRFFRHVTTFDYFRAESAASGDEAGSVEVRIPRILTGLELYRVIRECLLGSLKQRQCVAWFEQFLAKRFFLGEQVTLIPRHSDHNLNIKIGRERERPVRELGEGLQHIILLTFPLAFLRDRCCVLFIEEPELFLHPGVQRELLETFLDPTVNAQVFMATHSNHLLDMTFDFIGPSAISVFRFSKSVGGGDEVDPSFKIEVVQEPDRALLQELGVRNSSVFLTNCTIWVEGITDRVYLRRILEVLQGDATTRETMREDVHYSFFEYAGGNLGHWYYTDEPEPPIDVKRLCGHAVVVADQDEGKGSKHAKMKELLKDRYLPLEVREIENLLTPEVLWKVVEQYEGRATLNCAFDSHEYRTVPLGRYIDEKLGSERTRRGAYATESGTLSDKLGFCRRATSLIVEKKDLSDEAIQLGERLLRFVRDQNGKAKDA